MNQLFRVAVVVLALAGVGGTTSAAELTPLQLAVLNAEQAEAIAWAKRDVDAIMEVYASDTRVFLSGSPERDHVTLRQSFVEFLQDPGFTLTFRSEPPMVASSGDLAVTTGVYALTATDRRTQRIVTSTGKHLMTWRLEADKQWRVIRQMTIADPSVK